MTSSTITLSFPPQKVSSLLVALSDVKTLVVCARACESCIITFCTLDKPVVLM